ncbi:replication initiation protein [Thiolinea disciformis]|uniref:replication initiation protein n=1 Tax=Thiolinea disciformis TaxID=125614 RepID=UPI000368938A|nr:replication initiation protein [Thiolinea disciformis]
MAEKNTKTEKNPFRDQEKMIIKISNLLTRAAHGLSLPEKRILMIALGKIDGEKVYNTNPVARVHASEIAEIGGIDIKTAYLEARNGQQKLYERSISMLLDIKTGLPVPGGVRWVARAHYHKNEGWIEIAFNIDLVPYISKLKNEFTSYKLSRAGALRSIYSWRLFELLMQFKTTGLLAITVADFQDFIEAEPSHKKNFANLRIRVIEPAIKEIGEKDGLNVTWKPITAGRKTTGLEFRFPRDPKTALPFVEPEKLASDLKSVELKVVKNKEDLSERQKIAEKQAEQRFAELAAARGIEIPSKKVNM